MRFAAVSASRRAIFGLTESGEVLHVAVGRGANGEISAAYVVRDKVTKALSGKQVRQICCRFGQAYAVTESGACYAWGKVSGDGTPKFVLLERHISRLSRPWDHHLLN